MGRWIRLKWGDTWYAETVRSMKSTRRKYGMKICYVGHSNPSLCWTDDRGISGYIDMKNVLVYLACWAKVMNDKGNLLGR